MRILMIMAIISTAFLSCKCSSKMSSKIFTVESATRQGFVKGMQQPDGKHAGTSYTIIYTATKDAEVTNLYIGTKEVSFESFLYEGKNYLSATIYTIEEDAFKSSLPLAYKGEALILYSINGKKYQHIIEQFDAKEKVEGI
jgi:hypothetical protein